MERGRRDRGGGKRNGVEIAGECGWLTREKVETLIESRTVVLRTQYAPL